MISFSGWLNSNKETIDSVISSVASQYMALQRSFPPFPDVAVVVSQDWYYAVETDDLDSFGPRIAFYGNKPLRRILSEVVQSKITLYAPFYALFPLTPERHEEIRQNGDVIHEEDSFYIVHKRKFSEDLVVFKGIESRFPAIEGL